MWCHTTKVVLRLVAINAPRRGGDRRNCVTATHVHLLCVTWLESTLAQPSIPAPCVDVRNVSRISATEHTTVPARLQAQPLHSCLQHGNC
jgi:hypothetical protein